MKSIIGLLLGLILVAVRCDITPVVQTVSDRIYLNIDLAYPCTRLLTESGEFGCTSSFNGDSGVLYLIDDDDSYQSFIKSPVKDTILVLDSNYFNSTIVNSFSSKKIKINGLIVLIDNPRTQPYSPDVVYPNKKYGLYPNSIVEWNPIGESFAYQKFSYPMFAIDVNNSAEIRSYSMENRNGKYPAYGAELRSFMQGSINAETCLRRGNCVPLGGQSVWSTFSYPLTGTKDIILVMATLDSTAFFHDISPGAESTVFSQLVLLNVMEALAKVNQTMWNVDIIFALWNGERWGYTGSTKFVNDIMNFQCTTPSSDGSYCSDPFYTDLTFESIKLSNIKYIIELSQMGRPVVNSKNNESTYYLHSVSKQNPIIQSFIDNNTPATSKIFYQISTASEIPPSSVMSFLKQNININHVVVADHDQTYNNPFYGSHSDDLTNVDLSVLPSITMSIANLIDQLAGGAGGITTVNEEFMSTLSSCLLESFTCPYFNDLLNLSPFNSMPNFYTSVFGTSPNNQYLTIQSTFFRNLMYNISAYATLTNQTCQKNSDCQSLSGSECIGSICTASNTHYHQSLSLGFSFNEKAYIFTVSNASYPIFVESNWDFNTLRLYQLSNPTSEILFLVFGIVEFFVLGGAIILVRRYLSKKYKLL